MRVFGIDPGSHLTGYGIVEKRDNKLVHIDNGVVRPQSNQSFNERLRIIYQQICDLLDEFKPDVVALEDTFVAKNAKSAMKLGQARGVAILAASVRGLDIVEYHPTHIKQAITGVGGATKSQIQMMVKAILKLPDVAQEDASDALAVAICHLHSAKIKQMIERKK